MNLVFASDSIWNWDAEKNYKVLMEENPDLVKAARRGSSVIDPETGLTKPEKQASVDGEEKDGVRKASLIPQGGGRKSSLVPKNKA